MNKIIKDILKRVYFLPWNILNFPTLALNCKKIPKRIECIGKILIINKGVIKLGERVRIRSGFKSNPIGLGYKTVFHVFKGAELTIGNHVKMSNTAICCAKEIVIDDEVMIGGGVCIYDTDFHSLNHFIRMELVPVKEIPLTKAVHIEYGAFIGAGSIILKGVTVGKYSIVGAGSVISKDVPPMEVWGGNPARFIRKLKDSELSQEINTL